MRTYPNIICLYNTYIQQIQMHTEFSHRNGNGNRNRQQSHSYHTAYVIFVIFIFENDDDDNDTDAADDDVWYIIRFHADRK